MRFSHFIKDYCGAMLRRDFKLSADVILYEFTHEFIVLVLYKVVIADTRTYKHALYALDCANFTQHIEVLGVIHL